MTDPATTQQQVLPEGRLVHLDVSQIKPSVHNPRRLFDPEPLAALKDSIREHGVLVPLTVYRLPGQKLYAIIDGERRYRCCVELVHQGVALQVPANIVPSPDTKAALIYMFNIHQFREQWELMPTAIALQSVIKEIGTKETKDLCEVTGLSERQVERCKLILTFPVKYQRMSLEQDPKVRIPSNFWVELHPVLELAEDSMPAFVEKETRWGITDRLVEKYRNKRIKSVIHFRKILEAYDLAQDDQGRKVVIAKLRDYIRDPKLETREAFDGLVLDPKRVQRAKEAADHFLEELRKAKISHTTDGKEALIKQLTKVRDYVQDLIATLEGEDPPEEE